MYLIEGGLVKLKNTLSDGLAASESPRKYPENPEYRIDAHITEGGEARLNGSFIQ